MEERREHPRVQLVVKVTNKSTKEFHYFYSRNVSLGGIFLETRQPYRAGTDVELDFFIPSGEKRQRVLTNGKVARVVEYLEAQKENTTPGMGVKFNELPSETMGAISTYVRENLPEKSSPESDA